MAADVALTPKFFAGYADDWYFARYRDFFLEHSFEKEAPLKITWCYYGRQVVFDGKIGSLHNI